MGDTGRRAWAATLASVLDRFDLRKRSWRPLSATKSDPAHGEIAPEDVLHIEELLAPELCIERLDGIGCLTNLTVLELQSNRIHDLAPLARLSALRTLNLSTNQGIADLAPLATLTSLEWLNVESNHVSDVTPLVDLANLRILFLSENIIRDAAPLVMLRALFKAFLLENELDCDEQRPSLEALEMLTVANGGGIAHDCHEREASPGFETASHPRRVSSDDAQNTATTDSE